MTASYTPQAQSTINLITKKFALNNRFTQFTTAVAPEISKSTEKVGNGRPGASTALGGSKIKTHNFKTLATFGGARKSSQGHLITTNESQHKGSATSYYKKVQLAKDRYIKSATQSNPLATV